MQQKSKVEGSNKGSLDSFIASVYYIPMIKCTTLGENADTQECQYQKYRGDHQE